MIKFLTDYKHLLEKKQKSLWATRIVGNKETIRTEINEISKLRNIS